MAHAEAFAQARLLWFVANRRIVAAAEAAHRPQSKFPASSTTVVRSITVSPM